MAPKWWMVDGGKFDDDEVSCGNHGSLELMRRLGRPNSATSGVSGHVTVSHEMV